MQHDQVEFMPQIPVWFNVCISMNNIHHMLIDCKINIMIIQIDAGKAFFKIYNSFIKKCRGIKQKWKMKWKWKN